MNVEELPRESSYAVVVDGVPIAPGHPLTMVEASELWQVYARRPEATAEIRIWPAMVIPPA